MCVYVYIYIEILYILIVLIKQYRDIIYADYSKFIITDVYTCRSKTIPVNLVQLRPNHWEHCSTPKDHPPLGIFWGIKEQVNNNYNNFTRIKGFFPLLNKAMSISSRNLFIMNLRAIYLWSATQVETPCAETSLGGSLWGNAVGKPKGKNSCPGGVYNENDPFIDNDDLPACFFFDRYIKLPDEDADGIWCSSQYNFHPFYQIEKNHLIGDFSPKQKRSFHGSSPWLDGSPFAGCATMLCTSNLPPFRKCLAQETAEARALEADRPKASDCDISSTKTPGRWPTAATPAMLVGVEDYFRLKRVGDSHGFCSLGVGIQGEIHTKKNIKNLAFYSPKILEYRYCWRLATQNGMVYD